MKTVRVGIMGSGFIAKMHAARLKDIEGVQIVGIVDCNSELANAMATELELEASIFETVDAMLDADLSLDAVYFCVPPFVHNGEVESVAAKGIHVFLEKPIALDSEKASSMVEAIEKAGVVSQVGFMMRFRKSVQLLKKKIESGEAGPATLFSGRFWVNMDGAPWWRDIKGSGGQVFEQVIHLYDLALYLCDGDVESAMGALSNQLHQGRDDYSIEDTSAGILKFSTGAIATISGSNCAVDMRFFGDFQVACGGTSLEYQCSGQPWVEADKATLYGPDGAAETIVEDDDSFAAESAHFIECIREGKQTLCPARDGLRAIQVVEQVLQAANS
ncbi:Gfo/Idh/MocA family protein [Pelagicoccus mobilis]|uniref:Gfo/Idh/MocA family oxidoreductase n=1 Tax=Pelagicoccus mobilis TaxID=415221 RepID=A0A934RZA7_9BACT|nr:Gfo/Idh/MocA family oxidoreductase [Pelagicoccus mobilis]MBK1880450.1 Gfo/Idh/MocA family oxidoreductase [Pelagicoccus mobilis]